MPRLNSMVGAVLAASLSQAFSPMPDNYSRERYADIMREVDRQKKTKPKKWRARQIEKANRKHGRKSRKK